jgi:hypothetical protein
MIDNINITHTDNTDNTDNTITTTIIHIVIIIINHNSNKIIMIHKIIIIKSTVIVDK